MRKRTAQQTRRLQLVLWADQRQPQDIQYKIMFSSEACKILERPRSTMVAHRNSQRKTIIIGCVACLECQGDQPEREEKGIREAPELGKVTTKRTGCARNSNVRACLEDVEPNQQFAEARGGIREGAFRADISSNTVNTNTKVMG
jgi:hypothetical protein